MDLSSLLKPRAVRVVTDISSKKRLLQSIADMAEDLIGLPSSQIFDALQERESLGPTGVGHGVALPHARLPALTQVQGAFLRLEKPIDFDSADRQPVDLVFALFAPADTGVDHLKALALVSRTLRDQALCAKLRANTDPATLYTILTAGAETQAA
ncbi:PTS sugar transporter subunit IIA [Roseibacterium sp. SDUM158016]|jgi:PTS system nitrogen regulatory IIA component|uniref:PTS sugar transporter subunit IIA n=1 Tax=Roseicyclus sediminis TaxID=2980997 RepID=UPI0021CF711D|nr:PTS sugar transporter subunit IIA [Roseibacterium sp. SDUM158016]MCU4652261.1 PTS sugar transporter subunit IIA [Roseibacterium sp. SDUM158016]